MRFSEFGADQFHCWLGKYLKVSLKGQYKNDTFLVKIPEVLYKYMG